MATENKVLTDAWLEVSTGPVSIVIVSGRSFWAFNGSTAPTGSTRLQDYVPITGDFGQAAYSYGGTEKTFCRIAGDNKGVVAATGLGESTVVSVTAIV